MDNPQKFVFWGQILQISCGFGKFVIGGSPFIPYNIMVSHKIWI